MTIVPVYAALLGLMFLALGLNVVKARIAAKVALGTGGDATIERRARVHANFAEYVPFALLLLAMAEMRGAWPWATHLLCLTLVAGRASHAWGMSSAPEDLRFRKFGMRATFAVYALAAVAILATIRL